MSRLGILASLAFLPFLSPAASAEKANQVTFSGGAREDRTGGAISYLHAFSGNLRKAGPLVRFGASSGLVEDDDGNYSVELLAGWQSYYDGWRFRALAGVLYRDRSGESNDSEGLGFKVSIQATSAWSAPTYLNATANYDTVTERASSRLQVGRHFKKLIVGPEAGIVWSSENVRYEAGMFLTGAKLGQVSLSFRAGYGFNENDDDRKNSPYLGISATYQF